MTDLSKLSKEELLSLLKEKDESKMCIYKPIRGAQKNCTSKAVTPYGFCKRHSQTTQARIKKREMDEEEQRQAEEPQEEQPQEEQPQEETPLVEEPVEEVIQKVTNGLPKKQQRRRITPNRWGRFEDRGTHICFDPDTKKAYGVQAKDGSCRALGEQDIRTCIKNGWDYLRDDSESDDSELDASDEEVIQSESESESYSESEEELSQSESEEESDEEYSEEDSDYSEEDFEDYY